MALKLKRPYPPMEAKLVAEIPTGPGWQYEPKWDGFRCLAFRDGTKVELQSKAGQPLTRYFPEIVAALGALKANRFVLDGELVVPEGKGLSFDALLQRLHPAESRVRKLAAATPAMYVVFDLLLDDAGKLLTRTALKDRRRRLQAFAKKYFKRQPRLRLSPATTDLAEARGWFRSGGGNAGQGKSLDGIIAKHLDMPYTSGDRTGMEKVKHQRTADCVVGGFRYAAKSRVLGSLLLGLYDDAGLLHHVGFTSSFKHAQRRALLDKISKYRRPVAEGGGFTGRAPGGPSRWATQRSGEWEPLDPRLVVEVQWDHFTGGRFRHGTKLLRWRPDKSPRQCTMKQVETENAALSLL
jgi:ATP-dependent DNA ligase